MKQRSATSVSSLFNIRVAPLVIAIIFAVASFVQMVPVARADRFDDQIAAIQRQIDHYQAEAAKLKDQENTLQLQLNALSNEKAQIQAKIDLDQAQFDKLVSQIAQTEKDIATNKSVLGETIASLYIDGTVSPLEMLASSRNIGDYVDKQTYQASVRDELTNAIKRIEALRIQLQKQKSDVEVVLDNQKRARDALSQKEAEQQALIAETQGQESVYQQLSAESQQQKLQVQQAQQAAILAASNRHGGVVFVGGGDGGYPWNSSNCYVDQSAMSHGGSNGMGGDGWGYGCRQCASYAAWKIGERTGIIPTYLGNANQFPGRYPASSKGTTARANSVGVITAGQYGHVVWVESDPDSEGNIIVSQYNANYTSNNNNWGNFTRIKTSQLTYDVYIYF